MTTLPTPRVKTNSPLAVAQAYYTPHPPEGENSLLHQLRMTDDLEQVGDSSEMALVATLRSRLQLGIPFSKAGPLLISVKSSLDPAVYFNSAVKAAYSSEGEDQSLPPHLYSASVSAYKSLQTTHQSQAIVLLGHSGSGKTFDLIHLLDHLVSIASSDSLSREVEADKTLFRLLHSGIQALHIMGSVMSEHNLESTTCGLVVEVKYDAQFRAIGGGIRAKLLDSSLPRPRNGRTYQVLHSLICANKQILQGLGLHSSVPFRIFQGSSQSKLKVLDSESWLRFVDCLGQLSLSKGENQGLLDLLACVIHLFDIPFVGSNYIPRGSSSPSTHWIPRNRSIIQKVCRLLGCTEEVFMDVFTGSGSKAEAEGRLVDLARSLFDIAFSWLLGKINEYLEIHCQSMIEVRMEAALSVQNVDKWSDSRLKQEKRSIRSTFQPLYSISLVDFPGFASGGSLGTLSKNLALETLHLYCSSSYVTLLSALASEGVRFQHLDVPRCKDIVDLFLGKEVALAANLGLGKGSFGGYWEELKAQVKSEAASVRGLSVSEDEEFSLQYTWTKLSFNLGNIRAEAAEQFGTHLNSLFFRKCSSPLLAKSPQPQFKDTPTARTASAACCFGERLSNALSYLMKPLLSITPSIIYCLHSTQNEDGDPDFPLHATVSLFRNSLLRPQIVWKWFGLPIWRTKSDLLDLFEKVVERSDAGLELVLREILKEGRFAITNKMVMLAPKLDALLWSVIDTWGKGVRDPAGLRKAISTVDRKNIHWKEPTRDLFAFEASGFTDFAGSLNDYMRAEVTYEVEGFETFSANLAEDSVALLKELPRNKHFERPAKKPSIKTLQTQINTVLLQSRKDFAVISKSLRTPEVMDYTDLLPVIVFIQAHFRGFLARKYSSVLMNFTRKARIIQANWRGFKARKLYKSLLISHRSAIAIQRQYRRHYGKRLRAAILIQRWYQGILNARYEAIKRPRIRPRNTWTGKTSIPPARDQYAKSLKTGVRSAQRPMPKGTDQRDEYTFTPEISKNSQRLAQTRHFQLGEMPFHERFKVMETERQRKIQAMVQDKLEQESRDFTGTPQVNRSRSPGSRQGFYERQMEKLVRLKRWKDAELIKKDAQQAEELTFVPKIQSSERSRGIERTIQSLYVRDMQTWDKLRQKGLKTKREESERHELSQLRPKVDLSPVSQRLMRSRKERESESDRTLETLVSRTLPYWPSQAPNSAIL